MLVAKKNVFFIISLGLFLISLACCVCGPGIGGYMVSLFLHFFSSSLIVKDHITSFFVGERGTGDNGFYLFQLYISTFLRF